MGWSELAINPQPIAALFSSEPSLENVRILRLALNQDGPDLSLSIDLNDFPSNPPIKWVTQGFNQVLLEITCGPVRNLRLHGWDTDNIGTVLIQKTGKALLLEVTTDSLSLAVEFDFLRIDRVSAYCDESV